MQDKNHEKGERIKEDVSKETNETRGDKSKREPSNEKNKKGKDKKGKVKSEFELEEYCIRNHYKCVTDALELFKDDCLCSKPGKVFFTLTKTRNDPKTNLHKTLQCTAERSFLLKYYTHKIYGSSKQVFFQQYPYL